MKKRILFLMAILIPQASHAILPALAAMAANAVAQETTNELIKVVKKRLRGLPYKVFYCEIDKNGYKTQDPKKVRWGVYDVNHKNQPMHSGVAWPYKHVDFLCGPNDVTELDYNDNTSVYIAFVKAQGDFPKAMYCSNDKVEKGKICKASEIKQEDVSIEEMLRIKTDGTKIFLNKN